MSDVTIVTVGAAAGGWVAGLREAAAAAGLSAEVVDASARSLPAFDARPADRDEPGVVALRAACRRARALAFAVPAASAGCAGSVLNLLQLAGGAAYDAPERPVPLAGRPVAIHVVGPAGPGLLALEQLEAALAALGAAVVHAARAGTAGERSPAAVLARLRGGPGVRMLAPPVDLGLGHVQLPVPEVVAEAVRAAAADVSLYTPPEGLPRLHAALARHLGVPRRELVVTLGASGGLSAALGAHVPAGGGVLVCDPGFPNYRGILAARGLEAIPYRLAAGRGFLPDLDELAALAPRARAIVWNSPHNPTGAVAPPALVRELVELATAHDLLILSDEVYADLVWDGEHRSPRDAGGAERTIAIGSFSKSFAMAGHRVGWVVAPPALADGIRRVHWAEHMSPPALGQRAAAAALAARDDLVPPLRRTLQASRAAAVRRLRPAGLLDRAPAGAFYLWLDVGATGMDGAAYAAAVAREHALQVMPGSAYGASGAGRVRVSFAAPPATVDEGCRRLAAFHLRHARPAPREVTA